MNDALFHTLAAVALMCQGHFHGSFSGYDMRPLEGAWEPGFEHCALVIVQLDLAKDQRAKAEKAEADTHDKARLENALNAIRGKDFAPEAEPEPPKNSLGGLGGCSWINTDNGLWLTTH